MSIKNVLLLFGGKSFEHDISIITAIIIKNKYVGKYNLLPVYISKDNEWFFYDKDDLQVSIFKDFSTTFMAKGFKKAYLKQGCDFLFYKSGFFQKKIHIDAVLNCCHGGMGEDGRLNSFLNLCNIPISSGSSMAMGIAMDKVVSKFLFDGLKIKNIKYITAEKNEFQNDKNCIIEKCKKFGFPLIIKPATLGSSIGINVVHNESELDDALAAGFEFDNRLLIEQALIDGMKEFNVACIKVNGKIVVSEVDAAIKSDEILSFNDKYIGNSKSKQPGKIGTKTGNAKGTYIGLKPDFPAKIDEKLRQKMRDMAFKVYDKLKLYGPVRIDFIVDKKSNVYLNEINAVPGSLAYYFFVPSVYKTMGEYLDNIVDEGIKEFKHLSDIKNEYITNLI